VITDQSVISPCNANNRSSGDSLYVSRGILTLQHCNGCKSKDEYFCRHVDLGGSGIPRRNGFIVDRANQPCR
jgi:D-arabinose 1-dehydrogenase-like Zn-dependent alcohol dehydrogenase